MSKQSGYSKASARFSASVKKTVVAALFLSSVIVPVAGADEGKEELQTIYHVYMNEKLVGVTANADKVQDAVEKKFAKEEERLGELAVKADDQLTLIPEQVFEQVVTEKEVLSYIENDFEMEIPAVAVTFGDSEKPQLFVKDQETADALVKELKLTQVTEEELAAVEKRKAATEPLPELTNGQTRIMDVRLSTDISEEEVTAPAKEVLSLEDAVALVQKGTLEERKYRIQEGDVLGGIAAKHDLTTKDLLGLNPELKEDGYLQIGEELNVTVTEPIAKVFVDQEKAIEKSVPHDKKVIENDQLPKGDTNVKQEGKDGKNAMTYRITLTNGKQVSKDVITQEVLSEPVTHVVEKGTKVIPSRGSGEFVWPAVGGYVSSKMGMRWGRMHKGIDIARPSDRTIKSVDNGKVVFAGVDGGYGNKVVVDHQNGYRTTYAHLQSISVSVGQTVSAGGTLGQMGSTGHSTGVHLHLEVEKNGRLIDPLSKL